MPNNFNSKNITNKSYRSTSEHSWYDFFYYGNSALNQLLKEAQTYARVTGQEEHNPEEKLKKLYKMRSGSDKSSGRKESDFSQEEICEDADGFRFKSPSVDCDNNEIDDFF